MPTSRVLAGALEPRRPLPHFSRPWSKGLPFLYLLLPGTYQAVSLLGRLPGNWFLGSWFLRRARRGGDLGGDSTWTLWQYSQGRWRRQRAEKGGGDKEGSPGSSLTSCLTVTSIFTLFFRGTGVGVSAAGAGLGGSGLGSQQIHRE